MCIKFPLLCSHWVPSMILNYHIWSLVFVFMFKHSGNILLLIVYKSIFSAKCKAYSIIVYNYYWHLSKTSLFLILSVYELDKNLLSLHASWVLKGYHISDLELDELNFWINVVKLLLPTGINLCYWTILELILLQLF